MKAWKTVDAEHADAVARGALLVGTLASYVEIERARAPAAGAPDLPVPGYWVFCMTEPGWRPAVSDKSRVVFEISDVALLSRYIMSNFAVEIQGGGHGAVRYGPQGRGRAGQLDAFVKDEAFAAERETRIVFDPRPGVAVDAPLLMKPNYAVAPLFRRLD
jgi:hypothetical protein